MMAIMNDDTEKYEKMLKTLEVPLIKEDREVEKQSIENIIDAHKNI